MCHASHLVLEPQAFFDFDRTAERTLALSLLLVPACQLYDQQHDLAAEETTEVLVYHRPVSVRSRTLNCSALCLPLRLLLSVHTFVHPSLSACICLPVTAFV